MKMVDGLRRIYVDIKYRKLKEDSKNAHDGGEYMKFCVDCHWCFEEQNENMRWAAERYKCENPKIAYVDPVDGGIVKIAGMCDFLRSSQDVHHCGLEASFFKEKNSKYVESNLTKM